MRSSGNYSLTIRPKRRVKVLVMSWNVRNKKVLKSIEKFWTVSNTVSLLKKLKLFNQLK